MKKVLLGTSAIALAGAFAAPADAAEWTVRVGGYFEAYTGFADVDTDDVWAVESEGLEVDGHIEDDDGDLEGIEEDLINSSDEVFSFNPDSLNGDFDGVDLKRDSEIHFLPSITLDNGLQFGANIQLEGASGSDQIDEAFLFIDGSFGEINLGSENSAGYKMTYAAPDVTFINVNSGSLTAFVPFSGPGAGADVFRGTLGTSFIENERNNDAERITYYTPRFAGFQAGVSYARDGNQDSNAQVDVDSELSDIVDIGANYVNSFGALNIAISGRYGFANAPSGPDPDLWSVGANLGYAGFTVGGSFAKQNDAGTEDGEFWDAGVSYETGPWGFSFTHSRGKNVDDDCTALDDAISANDDNDFENGPDPDSTEPQNWRCTGGLDAEEELHQYLVGISYAMAKGVTLNVFGAFVEFEGAEAEQFQQSGSPQTREADIDGWVVGTGVKIAF